MPSTVQISETLTPEARHDYLRAFGLGERTGVELPGESAGLVHPAGMGSYNAVKAAVVIAIVDRVAKAAIVAIAKDSRKISDIIAFFIAYPSYATRVSRLNGKAGRNLT